MGRGEGKGRGRGRGKEKGEGGVGRDGSEGPISLFPKILIILGTGKFWRETKFTVLINTKYCQLNTLTP